LALIFGLGNFKTEVEELISLTIRGGPKRTEKCGKWWKKLKET